MRFIQEKIAHIPSSNGINSIIKSAVATTHINGITSQYTALKNGEDNEFVDSDTDDNQIYM